jgi:hypothetical protein
MPKDAKLKFALGNLTKIGLHLVARQILACCLAKFVFQILLFINFQNNMGRKKRYHLEQFGKFCFQKPKNQTKSPAKHEEKDRCQPRSPRVTGDMPSWKRWEIEMRNCWRGFFLILLKKLWMKSHYFAKKIMDGIIHNFFSK